MQLTNNQRGKEVVRIAPYMYPNGVADLSFLKEPMELYTIKDDGTLVFITYSPLMYMSNVYLGKETPKENYSYTKLDASWNDGKWTYAYEEEVAEGILIHDAITNLAKNSVQPLIEQDHFLAKVDLLGTSVLEELNESKH